MNDVPRDEELNAPAGLIEAFRRVSSERIFVPPTIDEAILQAAKQKLKASGRTPRRVWWWRTLAAASVTLLVFALATVQWPRTATGRYAVEDINHDGQIDILDAFALARKVKQENTFDKRLDLNGDGVIDEKDVATIAARAVKLERGGRS